MTAPVRVLLVEDDASLQRFVAMALEDQDVLLVGCTSVDEALLTLGRHGFDLIITDLMLPVRHGQELLAELRAQPELRRDAMLAVFSAGLNAQVRRQLEGLGVGRFLVKPCSLAELRACVDEARKAPGMSEATDRHAAQPSTQTPPQAPAQTSKQPSEQPSKQPSKEEQQADAIATFFGDNTALYEAFLARCKAQFPKDLAQGREAVQRGDAQSLRHLAHSLKSVLTTLGYPEAAATARALEDLAHQASADPAGHAQALRDAWQRLDAAVSQQL